MLELAYLVKKGSDADDRLSVEQVLERQPDLRAKCVVFREETVGGGTRRYLLFESRQAAVQWYSVQPEGGRHYHEVVLEGPQFLKLDLDVSATKLGKLKELFDAEYPVEQAKEKERAKFLSDQLTIAYESLFGELPSELPARPVCQRFDNQNLSEPITSSVDPEASSKNGYPQELEWALRKLLDTAVDELATMYGHESDGFAGIMPSLNDVVLTDSSGIEKGTGMKYSLHAHFVSWPVSNSEEAVQFTRRLAERLPEPIAALIDYQVNGPNRTLRVLGSSKAGSSRQKRATAEVAKMFGTRDISGRDLAGQLEATALRPRPYTPILPKRYSVKVAQEGALCEPGSLALRNVLDSTQHVTEGHVLRCVVGPLLVFDRQEPTVCRVCSEVRGKEESHRRDNTLMLKVVRSGRASEDGFEILDVLELCRHSRGRAVKVAEVCGEEARVEEPEAEDGATAAHKKAEQEEEAALVNELKSAREIRQHVERLNRAKASPGYDPRIPTRFSNDAESVGSRTVYCEETMRPFEVPDNGTLAVVADMGTGKTKALRAYVDSCPESERQLIVSFRQTFTKSVGGTFKEFVQYNDVSGELTQQRLIVQVESLSRVPIGQASRFDLLVLDEVESILDQFNSGLHRNPHESVAVFFWLLRTARRVIVMDANLSDRTHRLLSEHRPGEIALNWNRFQRAAGDRYHLTSDQGGWLRRLFDALETGKRIVVATNSLSEGRSIAAQIGTRFPDKQVQFYSSETPASEKARHFADVGAYWTGIDALIYTPTLSAGVSYTGRNFDQFFGYFTDKSCTVEVCRQMSARVRDIADREYHICLSAAGASYPSTPEGLHQHLRLKRRDIDSRRCAGRQVDEYEQRWLSDVSYEYDEAGVRRFYETPYFRLWLDTKVIENLSRNYFVQRYIEQVASTGASVEAVAAEVDPQTLARDRAARREHKAAKKLQRVRLCTEVAAAPNISQDENSEISAKILRKEDVSPEELRARDKYWLRERYRIPAPEAADADDPIDADFVQNYMTAAAFEVNANLRAITCGPTIEASLEQMRLNEEDSFGIATSTLLADGSRERAEVIDLGRESQRRYTYQAHKQACWLVCRLLGLAPFSRLYRSEADMFGSLAANVEELRARQDVVQHEFGTKWRVNVDSLARECATAMRIAANPDMSKASKDEAMLRPLARVVKYVNTVVSAFYGFEVRRKRNIRAYRVEPTSIGSLFVLRHSRGVTDFRDGELSETEQSADITRDAESVCEDGRVVIHSGLVLDAVDPTVVWHLDQVPDDYELAHGDEGYDHE